MVLKTISTEHAPRAIGPYSQGVQAAGMLFCSGQIGMDPETGDLVEGGVRQQTRRALENLSAVLKAGGSTLSGVVKTTVYLASLSNFAAMNEVYGEFFDATPPARSTVEIAGLPKGADVEIEAVALIS